MSNKNIIRAWKDPVYRNGLSDAERNAMPANPAGSIEISHADLGHAANSPGFFHTGGYCTVTFPRCM